MSLVVKGDVKKYLGITNDSADGLIDDLIAEAEETFKADDLGSKDAVFDAASSYQSYTEYYDGQGGRRLLVKHFPVRAVTAIYIDDSQAFGSDSQVAATAIRNTYFDEGIIELYADLFTVGQGNVKIVYTAGWKAADAPKDFKRIIINRVAATMLEGIGGVNVIEEQGFFYKPDKLRKEADRLAEKYRVIR